MLTEEQKNYLSKKKHETKPENDTKFDLRNRITDKNGEVLTKQDYFIHIQGGKQYFERPVGSGNLFFLSGEEAGRIEVGAGGKKEITEGAEHVEFSPPMDADAELFEKFKVAERQLEATQKELAAIKRDSLLKEREAALKAQGTANKLEAKAAKEEQ